MALAFRRFDIPGPVEIVADRIADARGFFSETFRADALAEAGIAETWVQDNHASSAEKGTLRGLHFQRPPRAQAKLVRVVRGAIFDAIADIRVGSPTFGRWLGVEISAEAWNQLYVPAGFAHGYLTLSPDTEVVYKASDYYSRTDEMAIRYDDPEIGIAWPDIGDAFRLSDKDLAAGPLAEARGVFAWDGA